MRVYLASSGLVGRGQAVVLIPPTGTSIGALSVRQFQPIGSRADGDVQSTGGGSVNVIVAETGSPRAVGPGCIPRRHSRSAKPTWATSENCPINRRGRGARVYPDPGLKSGDRRWGGRDKRVGYDVLSDIPGGDGAVDGAVGVDGGCAGWHAEREEQMPAAGLK